MNGKKLSPAAIVIMAAGVVALIASFLAFYKYSYGGSAISAAERQAAKNLGIPLPGGTDSYSAWSHQAPLLFPVSVLPALFGIVMALQIALTSFANVKLPEKVLGFTWKQIHLVLGAQAALMMLLYVIVDKRGASYGAGFWLMFLASIGLVVGAVMLTREAAPATGTAPPAI